MSYAILIVDDSLPMRSVIKRTFKAAGYGSAQFHEAANGQEALKLMETAWIDIVLTDFNMPVMNGLEFLKRLKASDLYEEIPVVVISTEGSDEKIARFTENGAAGYITKPFSPETLRDLITRILGETDDDDTVDDSDEDLDF